MGARHPHDPRLHRLLHDSGLGRWEHSFWRPDARLAGIVDAMWHIEGQIAYQRDRILPSGQSQLLINLGPTQYLVEPGPPERRVAFTDIWYSGLHQGPIDTEAPHGSVLIAVGFAACGAYACLRERMEGIAGRILPLADLLGDGVLRLRERLLDIPDVAARFEAVEQWLVERLQPRVHPAVSWAVDRIAASGGRTRVEELASRTGYTRKHLGRLFLEQVGFGPKTLARVHRFRGALALFDGSAGRVPWAELAEQCGYYDQAHLGNEIRRFTGLSPLELARHVRPDEVSIVLR